MLQRFIALFKSCIFIKILNIYFSQLLISILLLDSEDSDGEGGLGNVSRAVIRPVGHSGKAKRGHLCFDAAFETGKSLRYYITLKII